MSIKTQDIYFEFTSEELDELIKAYNLDLLSNPIPIWDKLNGKIVIGILIAFFLW